MDEDGWKKLEYFTELYKFNWNFARNLVFVTITFASALASYCIKNIGESPQLAYGLLLAMIPNLFIVVLFFKSDKAIQYNARKVTKSAHAIGLKDFPELKALTRFMLLAVIICFIFTIGLFLMFLQFLP
ncbi:hypothetical protein AU255_12440 [Methyloprofundus sedimenti]|uniref:Uncharacterized protein n=1 Tax=Methyloprofundus sedimenti TaxID=1420851 RepID=A0A1V8MAQ4_9GAMM|nr:hypothetical protein [Methyloprofundus sedimenti]OQK18582.1 hypothetical protein AU255_12440 [Methyloprofundus sedimenti]